MIRYFTKGCMNNTASTMPRSDFDPAPYCERPDHSTECRGRHTTILLSALVAIAMSGCTTYKSPSLLEWERLPKVVSNHPDSDPADLFIARGEDGRQIEWPDVLAASSWAQVILVGEDHEDAEGHRIKNDLLGDLLDLHPDTTLSLEFLHRDQQTHIDEHLQGTLSTSEFVELTGTADIKGPGTWVEWYHPLIDTAARHNSRVIGSNVPRRLARLAREGGYDSLENVDSTERDYYQLPRSSPSRRERKLFRAEMEAAAIEHGAPPGSLSDENVESFLRSQELWNGTMADSILREIGSGTPRVFHVVGGFHIEEHGGIARELRHVNPDLRILTIQLDPNPKSRVKGRADIVIRTRREDQEAQ